MLQLCSVITFQLLVVTDHDESKSTCFQHPGGVEIVMMEAGADATASFEAVGHSPDAKEMLIQFYIGELQMVEIAFSQSLQICLFTSVFETVLN